MPGDWLPAPVGRVGRVGAFCHGGFLASNDDLIWYRILNGVQRPLGFLHGDWGLKFKKFALMHANVVADAWKCVLPWLHQGMEVLVHGNDTVNPGKSVHKRVTINGQRC